MTSRRVPFQVLVDSCDCNLYKSESPFVLLTTMPPKAIPPKENTYLCSCPKCMVGMDTPKKVSWATYKRHRKDRLKVSSVTNAVKVGETRYGLHHVS